MRRAGRTVVALPLLILTLTVWGCGEDLLGPGTWIAAPDTVVLYSLARPELSLLSAFNLHQRATVHVETVGATTQWDIALDTRLGQLVLIPPGALGIVSRARVAVLPGMSFDEAVEAPLDTLLYTAVQPVQVQLNSVYVVRTDTRPTDFGGSCVYYAKLEPLAIDVTASSVEFVFDGSPVCNDRRLVPPEAGS